MFYSGHVSCIKAPCCHNRSIYFTISNQCLLKQVNMESKNFIHSMWSEYVINPNGCSSACLESEYFIPLTGYSSPCMRPEYFIHPIGCSNRSMREVWSQNTSSAPLGAVTEVCEKYRVRICASFYLVI